MKSLDEEFNPGDFVEQGKCFFKSILGRVPVFSRTLQANPRGAK